jgi:1-acyl-sn-glycerol-3-phosphate acyltransferase
MQSVGRTIRRFDEWQLNLSHAFVSLRSLYHSLANRAARRLMVWLFTIFGRVRVVGRENTYQEGGFLLAANHISHFDPFIISSIVHRKIDWMAMSEFFRYPVIGTFLRAVDAFPADRDRADRATIRNAIVRLRAARIVGLFPEGGIRDGAHSMLEGAPFRTGSSALAYHAQVPILPCVILGSDRFYSKKNWRPWRRTPLWIAFGKPIVPFSELEKAAARQRSERALMAAFQCLYADLREKFSLNEDDLPQPPRERMREKPSGTKRSSASHVLHRIAASGIDSAMCLSMNFVQSRHRLHAQSRDEMERYITECEKMTLRDFYALPETNGAIRIGDEPQAAISWRSPVETKFPENNTACAIFFRSRRGWTAPTVFLLHAFMSASDAGYRRWAARLNELGWSVCFVHLPYHYSRRPRGYRNGELAITADLIRISEGLRQGVIELRQLMAALRARGCTEFGVLGTSYGGWIGALLATVEADFRFVALMAPIINVEHALWHSPATIFMRRELRRAKIEPALLARHFHLSSPMHNEPLCCAERILFVAGEFDSIVRASDVEALRETWRGSDLLRVQQGHFGYRMFRETIARLKIRTI